MSKLKELDKVKELVPQVIQEEYPEVVKSRRKEDMSQTWMYGLSMGVILGVMGSIISTLFNQYATKSFTEFYITLGVLVLYIIGDIIIYFQYKNYVRRTLI